ncbi:plasmid pRiA4b ORF-3 family protein [Lentzea aerocolonigenes]|uniref:plasmid pRiA4b ORF-3 family protein n=1 Tax=Lentzea aerocolonigenes TaxID=68170 RepID=UPI00068DF904|nr:plasmid pRiA4b ORF-3 family protein [Lentzea aerocolonigenes]MCP2246358.1 pRiA4b ORF-3-like protein [Lentzea aerocolonigenes]
MTEHTDAVMVDLARKISEWVGDGKAVTSKGVLRPGDLREAASALGVTLPERFRSGADVPGWHVPWSAALGAGMLVIERGRVVARSVEVTQEVWLAGFVAALAALCRDEELVGAARIGERALAFLSAHGPCTGYELYQHLLHRRDIGSGHWQLLDAAGYEKSGDALLDLFRGFGAVRGPAELTKLGEWVLAEMGKRGDDVVRREVISAERICQLKISLERMSWPCWRRVLVRSGDHLGELDRVIQAAMRWDDDHLHAFYVGSHRYGDPGFDMEDEYEVAVGEVFTRSRKTVRYVYDFGDDWRHEIKLERVLDAEPGVTYPVCVAGAGAVPVEDSRHRTIKFDQEDINRRLAGLPAEEGEPMLEKVIEMIVVDAYGEDEQLGSFRTVFEDAVEIPIKATVLGHQIEVLEFDYNEPLRGVFAKCREGEVSLVDVCFPPDTVAAWIHAAYRDFLGLEPFPATPRPDWTYPN